MQPSWTLLKQIGMAVLSCAGEALPRRSLHRQLTEIAYVLWEIWGRQVTEAARIAEIEGAARAMGKVRPYVELIVQDIARDRSEETRKLLIAYLSAVPSTIRITLRRPSDPIGRTVPGWLIPRDAEDLLPFIPAQVPRFEPGDRPIANVDWELTDLLGSGGFGEVWKAINPTFQSVPPVVLKFSIDPKGGNKAFRYEAAILTQVMPKKPHPGIVELRATYMNNQPPCLEFEYINGGDLLQWFKGRKRSQGPPSLRTCIRLMLRLCRTVGYFHRRKPPIVHRDLKPGNILVRRRRGGKLVLKICDFGIGGLATTASASGVEEVTSRRLIKRSAMRGFHTATYASPQQVRGGPPDPRDDVHALGVIWFQLLMGDLGMPPPSGVDWIEDMQAIHKLSEDQVRLISSCFDARADLRPADAAVLYKEIKQRFKGLLAPTSPKPAAPKAADGKGDAPKGLARLRFWS